MYWRHPVYCLLNILNAPNHEVGSQTRWLLNCWIKTQLNCASNITARRKMGPLKSLCILFLAVLSLTLCVESRSYSFLPEKGKTCKVFRQIGQIIIAWLMSEHHFEFVNKWWVLLESLSVKLFLFKKPFQVNDSSIRIPIGNIECYRKFGN